MQILEKKEQVKNLVKKAKNNGKVIGFVPTMGYLHHGHTSLIKNAKKDRCFTIVSIFVNPLQFGPSEDFQRYPRNIERDLSILKNESVDAVFIPSNEEMYHTSHLTEVNVSKLSEKLEGKFRPGHFKGVCTVVLKLFNIVQPDKAYFGWKDAQQLIIIKKMVRDLDLDVKIVAVPTVREPDGLAASSRNIYLSEQHRKDALALFKALQKIKEMVELQGIKQVDLLIKEGKKVINSYNVELEYLEAVELETLDNILFIKKNTGVLGAIKVNKVRLIDNIIFE